MNLTELLKINENKISLLEIKLQNIEDKNIEKELKVQKKINQMLKKYGIKLFMTIDMETSLQILNKLVDEDKILKTYKELICIDNYR